MLSISSCHCLTASSERTAARMARATWRPRVEWSIGGRELHAGDRRRPVSSASSAHLRISAWPLRVADEHLRQRADLHRLALEARRLHPGILAVRPRSRCTSASVSSSQGCSGSSRRCTRRGRCTRSRSSRKYGSSNARDRLARSPRSPSMIVPPGRSNWRALAVERQVGHGQVVGHAARRSRASRDTSRRWRTRRRSRPAR